MTASGDSTGPGSRRSSSAAGRLASVLVVAAIGLSLLVAGVGVADVGNPGKSCPGENPNVGLENAGERGATASTNGIVRAFVENECPGDWNPTA